MAHGSHEQDQGLSIRWPFTFAGLCLTAALAWFCLGFALADRKLPEPAKVTGPIELKGHYTLFWLLLLIGAVSVALGIVVNVMRAKRRDA